MSRQFTLLGFALASFAAPVAQAQFAKGDADGGVHSMTMLSMAISPRAVGIGEAMAGIDRDPSAIWYNTAGLAGLKTNAFTVNASERFAQTQLVGAAVAFPTEIATFGIAARIFNAGTAQGFQAGQPTGSNVRAYQFALEGGGALQLAPWWRWGGTLAYAQEVLGDESQASVGINSGMQFPGVFSDRLTLGVGFRNFGTNVNFDETQKGFSPPMYGYVGGAYDLFKQRNLIQTPMLFRGQPIVFDTKLLAQLNMPDKDELQGRFGIEATVNGVALARIGYQTGDDNRKGLSLGAGVNVGQFRLEYAFRNQANGGTSFFKNDPIGDSHNVSFTYFWGQPSSGDNRPSQPIVITPPVDTAAINGAVRRAVEEQLRNLRPLLDSLKNQKVEILHDTTTSITTLIQKYIVPISFGFDSSVVNDTAVTLLRQVADVIKKVYPTALVTIEGFADPAGSDEYNRRLSLRRADAVKEILVKQFGMPEKQLKTVGYGKTRPVFAGAQGNQAGAEANRRVVFTIDATQHY
ncbi:MAG: PorV/PorQ family protein [Gemmatimonadota bacterium]|nr:PorV/PorQ family protein [Gemmatimonadota bacterium]